VTGRSRVPFIARRRVSIGTFVAAGDRCCAMSRPLRRPRRSSPPRHPSEGFAHKYYFKGAEKRLTYPWAKGLKVDQIYEYYREVGFTDWTHAETGAPALKAQHPEFENVEPGDSRALRGGLRDCHMPYMREGAMKISDHHVRSPLLNINRACQTCHKWSEDELKGRAEAAQQRTVDLRNRSMDALMALIGDIKAAKAAGVTDAQLTVAREFQRPGQFYLDFVESENSNGFHAPQEAARILGEAIDYLRQGQLAVRPAAAPASAPVPASASPRR
jgi:nitrite reductase (cytochrome c-552)